MTEEVNTEKETQEESAQVSSETEEERNVRLKEENDTLEKKNAGLEDDAKRNLSRVIETRQEKRSLISDEETEEVTVKSPSGDKTAAELKNLKSDLDDLKSGMALQAKTGEQEALQEIYKKFPDVAPENDPDGTKFKAVSEALQTRLKIRRGFAKDALVADFEDAYILTNKDKVLNDQRLAGKREGAGEQFENIGGTSTSSTSGGDELTLTAEEREMAKKLFRDIPLAEAEKMYMAGKRRRLGI